jgi:release factor glutamine methyltransferase
MSGKGAWRGLGVRRLASLRGQWARQVRAAHYAPIMVETQPEAWTVRRLLAWMQRAFQEKQIDSARLCAEVLLGHVMALDRLSLFTQSDRVASADELQVLRSLVARALRQEPVQYLVGEAWFFGLRLHVDRRVLIPRPCTEMIVEEVIQHVRRSERDGWPSGFHNALPAAVVAGRSAIDASATGGAIASADEPIETDDEREIERQRVEAERRLLAESRARRGVVGQGFTLADICTGSGCIAIALAKNLPAARIIATDVSADALEIAAMNAQRHGVHERIEFYQGNLLEPLADALPRVAPGGVDVLVSNPPYIPDHEWGDVPANVRDYEPELALRGGPEGVDLVAPIIRDGPALLKPGGLLMVELAACTSAAMLAYATERGELTGATIKRDLEGLERVVMGRRG